MKVAFIFSKLAITTFLTVVGLLFASQSAVADDKIRIVTTTTVLADLAGQIAGDGSEIFYVASPKRDIHKISPTPKDVLKTKKADVFIYHGLQLEVWLLPLLNAAGRSDYLSEDGASIDASAGVKPLEVPDRVNRIQGDIHPHGNPHYWVDPAHGKLMADNITRGLSRLFPDRATTFEAGNRAFQKRLDAKLAQWQKRMKPFEGKPVVTYHRSWSYFAKAYGLDVVGEIEPKPGIPVTSKHLSELKSTMNTQGVRLIIKEPHQQDKPPRKLAKETGAQVAELLQFNDAKKGVDDYLSLMEHNIRQIERAFTQGTHG